MSLLCCFTGKVVIQGETREVKRGFIRPEVPDVNRHGFPSAELYPSCARSVWVLLYVGSHAPNQAMLQEIILFFVCD